MANFLLYRYEFQDVEFRKMHNEDDEVVKEDVLNKMLCKLLESTFKTHERVLNLNGVIKEKDGMEVPVIYVNTILRCEEGVALVEVRNKKVRKYTPIDSTEKKQVDDYPYCWVIVDTRPGSRLIIVQKKREAFGSTDFVARLFGDCFTQTLSLASLGWKLNVKKRICSGDFWDVVHTRLLSGTDRVKTLSIHLSGEREDPQNEVERALQLVMRKFATPEGDLNLYSNDAAHELLDETNTDLVETVNMLICNNYTLKVRFTKSGTFEYGKKAEALYGIDDKEVKNFIDRIPERKEKEWVFALLEWIGIIVRDDNGHEYADIPKREGRNKRKNGKRQRKAV